jgi:hypothetical protein
VKCRVQQAKALLLNGKGLTAEVAYSSTGDTNLRLNIILPTAGLSY